jgi:hypothetical protein
LNEGALLVTLISNKSVGKNALPTAQEDIFVLEVATTSLSGPGDATAYYFYEGADAGIATDPHAFSLVKSNAVPTADAANFSLPENSPNGTAVGTVSGNDPDAGGLSFAILDGNQDGAFLIDATTGEITVADSSALDFETSPSFVLTVAAIDEFGAYAAATVTIDLNNVNEAPVNSVPGAQATDQPTGMPSRWATRTPAATRSRSRSRSTAARSVSTCCPRPAAARRW